MITKRNWRIVDRAPPQPPRRDGRIEAVARTPIMGFRDDVVVRVRAERRRLAHRHPLVLALRLVRFRHQCGARVGALLDDIDDAIGDAEAGAAGSAGAEEGERPRPKALSRPAKR